MIGQFPSGQPTGEDLLQVRDLSVTYRPVHALPIHALDGVSLRVQRKEIVGILGESGCGKSTLANALLRLLPASAKIEKGELFFQTHNLLNIPERELRSLRGRAISLIQQEPALSLNPVMTAGTQISEVIRAHMPLSPKERKERVLHLLKEVGFDRPEAIYAAYPHQLSGGQRQRIVIAQAISCGPEFIIADEPTSKLDAALCAEIVELLSAISERHGTAMLIITHDPTILAGMADRVAVMYGGRIVEVGPRAEIMNHPSHPYSQALMQLAKSSVVTGANKKKRLPTIEKGWLDSAVVHAGSGPEPHSKDSLCE
jgi:ABC-type dipeptide/oligopeptide/nickel transport system ATPase component